MYHWSSKKKRGKRESEAETTSEESLVKMDEKQEDQATNSSDITNPRQDKQNENITLKNENNKAYR